MLTPSVRQFIIAFGLWCHQIHCGFMFGVQAILLPALRDPDSSFHLTTDQESWIPSSPMLIQFLAQTLAGILTPVYGRKIILYFCLTSNTIAIILVNFSQDFHSLHFGMIFFGLSLAAGPLGSLFLSECCSPRLRGMMLDFKFASTYLGLAISRLSGRFCHWRTVILLGAVPLVISFLTLLYSPESPAWLASRGRFEECQHSFNFFRKNKEIDELNKLIEWQDVVLEQKRKVNHQTKSKTVKYYVNCFLDKGFLKASLITVVCMMSFVLGGTILLMHYIDVINDITKDPANRDYYNFALDASDLIFICISSIVVTKVPRRKLLFGVGIPAIVCLYIFCAVTYLSSLNLLSDSLSWLPFACIQIYFTLLHLSIVPVSYTAPGEIYPLSHRGLGLIIMSFSYGASTFVIAKTSPACLRMFGVHGVFFIYAISLSLLVTVLYFILPETFKITLQKIEQNLKGDYDKEMIEVNLKMIHS